MEQQKKSNLLAFAVKHKDNLVRANSRSGGIFTALSDNFINFGVIYGCVLDDKFDAYHERVETAEGRNKMRGSKYIQSQIRNCYKQVKEDLENCRSVLFTGTSCQVAGLKKYLQKDYENLICVDIVCHGVPSSKVWHKYLEWISRGEEVVGVDFRNKKDFGWASHVETIRMSDRKVDSEVFKNLFYGHHILRPSCYECPYKSIYHPSDITIADYWGIDDVVPGFNDNKGVSLVIVNTNKGLNAFEKCKKDIIYVKTNIEDSLQPPLKAPFPKPKKREKFWMDFENKPFDFIVKKYGTEKQLSLCRRMVRKIKRIINECQNKQKILTKKRL